MHLWGSLLAVVLLGLQCGVSALAHRQVATRDEVCVFYGIPYVEIYVYTYITWKTVQINTYITENTILNINGGVTININNAPTYLVTEVVATNTVVSTSTVSSTVTNIATVVQSTAGIPISSTGILIAPGSVQTPSAAAIESEALELFMLAVLPLQPIARRQATTTGFLANNGSMTLACENATVFQLRSEMLFDSTGALISISTNTNASLLASQYTEAQIATVFSIDGGVLSWTNPSFAGGASQFCRGTNGKVYAVFNGVISPGCTLINLVTKSTANCNAFDTQVFVVATPASVLVYEPTGGSAFSGPMFTVSAGIAGSTATAVTLLPTSGGLPIGTVIAEVPLGGTPFSGPFITSTSSVAGSTTATVTLLPTFSIPASLVSSAAAVVNALLDPSRMASALTPQQTDLIIVERPTGGTAFSGAYSTLNVAIAGTATISYTLPPVPGASTGLVIVEQGTGGLLFTGPYVTSTSFIGGLLTSTVTIPPTSLLPSITTPGSPQATSASPTITSFVALSSGQPQFTSTIPASGTSPVLVIIGTSLPTSFINLPAGASGFTSTRQASGTMPAAIIIGTVQSPLPTSFINLPAGANGFTSTRSAQGSLPAEIIIGQPSGVLPTITTTLPFGATPFTSTRAASGTFLAEVVVGFGSPRPLRTSTVSLPFGANGYTSTLSSGISAIEVIIGRPSSRLPTSFISLPFGSPGFTSTQPQIGSTITIGGSISSTVTIPPTFGFSATPTPRYITTTQKAPSGSSSRTVTLTPSNGGPGTVLIQDPVLATPTAIDPGTVLIQDPVLASSTAAYSYTTVTQTMASITSPVTITVPPSGGSTTGTVYVNLPVNAGVRFIGPYKTITTITSGSLGTTLTRPPIAGQSTGTIIIDLPQSSFSTFRPSLTTKTQTVVGPGGTITLPLQYGAIVQTVLVDISASVSYSGRYTTITQTGIFAMATTLTLLPSLGGTLGTVLVEQPTTPTRLPSLPISYVTQTRGFSGSLPTILTLQPSGTDRVGTVIYETPTRSPSRSISYVTTTIGITGSIATTQTLQPSNGGLIGTVLVQDPILFNTQTRYSGTQATTQTLLPASGGRTGTVLIQDPISFTTTTQYSGTLATARTLLPSNGGPVGTILIQDPISFTTTTRFSGSQATTQTILPSNGGSVGTVIVQNPTPSATQTLRSSGTTARTQTTLPSSASPTPTLLIQDPVLASGSISISFTTQTRGYTGSLATTQTIFPSNGGTLGTVLVGDPIMYVTIIQYISPPAIPTTITIQPSAGSFQGTVIIKQLISFVTLTTGYGGSVLATTTLSLSVSSGTETVLIEPPTSRSPTAYTTLYSGYSGSFTSTKTLQAGPDGSITVEILTPTSQGFSTSTTIATSSPSPTSTNLVQVTLFTTVVLGYSDTMTSTISLDGVISVEILTPTSTSLRQTSTTSNPTTCTSYTATPSKVCETMLPSACIGLGVGLGAGTVAALGLSTSVGLCSTALGIGSLGGTSGLYDPLGTIAQCLPNLLTIQAQVNALSSITAASVGASIDTCLTTALQSRCITALPQSCVNLGSTSLGTVLNVLTNLPACITDLGPFALDAVGCTATSVVGTVASPLLGSGQSLVTCLDDALGLEGTSTELVCTDSTGVACLGALPTVCSNIGLTNGLLVPQVLACVEALPPAIVTELGLTVSNLGLTLNNAVSTVGCIATTVLGIMTSTSGQDVLNCLDSTILCSAH